MADIVSLSVKIVKLIHELAELKGDLEANKKRGQRLIERIIGLEPAIDKIKIQNRNDNRNLLVGILKTIEDSHQFLNNFRRKMFFSKIIYRQNIKDDFLELNNRITSHISDLGLTETLHGQELQQQLEDDRIQDDEEMKNKIAELMDISKNIENGQHYMKSQLNHIGITVKDDLNNVKDLLKQLSIVDQEQWKNQYTEIKEDQIKFISQQHSNMVHLVKYGKVIIEVT